MTEAEPIEFEPVVTWRGREGRPWFNCVICGGSTPDYGMDDMTRTSGRMVCKSCARHWGRPLGLQNGRSTRGDKRIYQRLSAVTEALIWEAKNGRRYPR